VGAVSLTEFSRSLSGPAVEMESLQKITLIK